MDEILDDLSRLDACAISDALDSVGLAASISGLSPLSVRRRISGKVVTVRLAAGPTPADAPARHLCTQAIEMAARGDVIVIEHRSGVECAGWGGILSRAAAFRQIGGVIVDGLARDIDEATDIGFPVYARGSTARTARGRIHEVATSAPIVVGSAIVRNGDYVVADSSGVAFIPADRAPEIIAVAKKIAAKESAMAQAVDRGRPVTEVMGAAYETLLSSS